MDITDNPPDNEPLHVNFTYSVEWRHEKFLEYPGRHSRYFRIFLFVSERLRGQHLNVGAAWGKYVLYVMVGAWLRFLYIRGGSSSRLSAKGLTDGVEWLPSLGHPWLDAAFLLGVQCNVIVVLQFFLIWQSLVSPMIRGSLLQSILLTYLVTCPVVGCLAERRSIGWWRVMCLATLPTLALWRIAQNSLPDNCTGKLATSVTTRLVLGIGCMSWFLAGLGVRFSRKLGNQKSHLGEVVTPGVSLGLSSTIAMFDTIPLLLWGLVPFYFWSGHVSYGLECLWGRQFHVNLGILRKAWMSSSLLVGLGCVSIHQALALNPALEKFEEIPLRQSFGAGVVFCLGIWARSFHYFYYESCIPGQDSSGAQTCFYFGYTTLICITMSLMYSSIAVYTTFLWQRYFGALAGQLRGGIDGSWSKLRRQALSFTSRNDRDD